jgi:hypothetical protein
VGASVDCGKNEVLQLSALHTPSHTWPSDAAAVGSSVKVENRAGRGAPSSSSRTAVEAGTERHSTMHKCQQCKPHRGGR